MAWRRSRSSSTRSATAVRIDSSNTATASRPASLAWYMAVSASRMSTSAVASGSSPEANARPMLADT